MALLVRRLKVPDLPALELIEAARSQGVSWQAVWLSRFRELVETTLSEEPEALRVAELDGEVVGLAVARPRGLHDASKVTYGAILHLSVAPGFESRGVGERLLRECEAFLRSRGCELVLVSWSADAPGGLSLFE